MNNTHKVILANGMKIKIKLLTPNHWPQDKWAIKCTITDPEGKIEVKTVYPHKLSHSTGGEINRIQLVVIAALVELTSIWVVDARRIKEEITQ